MAGGNSALQSLEPAFHHDLNDDCTIGLHTTVIESFGSTVLSQIAGIHLPVGHASETLRGTGHGRPVRRLDADCCGAGGRRLRRRLEDRRRSIHPVGRRRGGNWLSQSAVLSGASEALVSRETAFQQDLNSDGDAPPSLLLADDPFRWFASGLGAIPAVPLSSCRHTARGD
jgi:serralysin